MVLTMLTPSSTHPAKRSSDPLKLGAVLLGAQLLLEVATRPSGARAIVSEGDFIIAGKINHIP